MPIIASFNVNSINARANIVKEYCQSQKPNILGLQELKCVNEQFPADLAGDLGYHATIHGQKSYNGVAILSQSPVNVIANQLPGDSDGEARFLWVEYNGVHIINIYAPNGNPKESEKFPKKMRFMENLTQLVRQKLLYLGQPLVIMGDYNIAPFDHDVYDTKALADDAIIDERARQYYFALTHLGLVDAFDIMNPNATDRYSYWDYMAGRFQKNQGVRIDHILVNGLMADRLVSCQIHKKPRIMERPSDHTPIAIEYK